MTPKNNFCHRCFVKLDKSLTFDPVTHKINRVPLTKFEEGRSRRSRVIDRKRRGA